MRELQDLARELQGRLQDEFDEVLVLALDPKDTRLFIDEEPFGAEVKQNLSGTHDDIVRAGQRLATDQPTACVYHLSRAVEYSLRLLATEIQVEVGEHQGMASVRRKCQTQLERWRGDKASDPRWKADEPFYANVLADIHAIETAWRNPVAHAGTFYSRSEAEHIWHVTQGLMQHLATKLQDANAL